jgi:predicted NBD/HSP70 family sugar kinase
MDTQRAIVAQLLHQPMSLAGLGAATGASLPTLRRAVQALQRARWVRVAGRAAATGGRPANLLGVDPDTHTVVGVHLEHPGMRLVATDLVGTVLDTFAPADVADLEFDVVHGVVVAYLAHLRRRFPQRTVLGLSLASPGYVDPVTGTVITIGRVPNWNNLPICQRLNEATGLRITIANDVDSMAAGEFGANGGPRNYAYVGVSEGVKFSMFLNGQPYVGPFGNAGLVSLRLLAASGEAGRAADVLTVHGLSDTYLRRAGERSGDGPPGASGPAGTAADGYGRVRELPDVWARFRAVLALVEEGDPTAVEVVGWMVDVLGAQLASFVHLIQPELLVIGGALAGAPERVLADVEASLRRRLPRLLDHHLIVRGARVTTADAAAIGATRGFVQRFLADEGPPLASVGG